MERGRLAGRARVVLNQDKLSQIREGGRCWKLWNNLQSDEFFHQKVRTLVHSEGNITVSVHEVLTSTDLQHLSISMVSVLSA